MQQSVNRDRFIPLRKADLIASCVDEERLDSTQQQDFEQLCHIISSCIHYEYHEKLEALKNSYAPFDPNADTIQLEKQRDSDIHAKQKVFSDTFADILNAANYQEITQQDLNQALSEQSLFDVRLAVEFDDFEEVVFYRRGEYQKTETVAKFWGLKKYDVSFTNYERVTVFIKFKDQAYFDRKKRSTANFQPSSTIVKLFQNVPKADLEMLFPNSEVRMRAIDKAIIGGSAIVGGGIMLATKLGATLLLLAGLIGYWVGLSDQEVTIGNKELLALLAGAGVLGGFIFKEWSKFKNRKLKFMKALADNLYFKNLDNNAGVFHHLIDAAEEEECKEIILAYYILLTSPNGLSEQDLDKEVERWFKDKFNFAIDFEIDDALKKLMKYQLVTENNGIYQALDINQAKAILDKQWDAIF